MRKWISPIPKKVHLIWIGGDPPDYFDYFLESFHKYLYVLENTLIKWIKCEYIYAYV